MQKEFSYGKSVLPARESKAEANFHKCHLLNQLKEIYIYTQTCQLI